MINKLFLSFLFIVCTLALSCARQTRQPANYYEAAYSEIAAMLDGKAVLSIKRAVFLSEWAYLNGNLDYGSYTAQIDSAAKAIKQFYTANRLNQFKTGLNVALFEYFAKPYSMNGHKPFTYDFDDFAGADDLTKLFVTKVMRTHSGQCHSLPVYYKVLAEAVGAEAHLAFAPQHVFIRHPDEQDPAKWVNVELTTQSLSREAFYIESFGITDDAIRNKVYLYPLTDKETVAFLLSWLAQGYCRKYQQWDDFTLRCAEKSLAYFPQNVDALTLKANVLNTKLMNGTLTNDQAQELNRQWLAIEKQLNHLGWKRSMDTDKYEDILQGVAENMRRQGIDSITIEKEMDRQRLLDKKPKTKNN